MKRFKVKEPAGAAAAAPVSPSVAASHCPAVLDAGLGGDVGPGQQRAQQRLGVTVQPLGDGAGTEAGQRGANVLDIVSGAEAVKENQCGGEGGGAKI